MSSTAAIAAVAGRSDHQSLLLPFLRADIDFLVVLRSVSMASQAASSHPPASSHVSSSDDTFLLLLLLPVVDEDFLLLLFLVALLDFFLEVL